MTHGLQKQQMLPIPDSYWVIEGQFLAGEYPGSCFSDEQMRHRLDAFIELGFSTMIDLTGEDEIGRYDQILQEQAGNYGVVMTYLRFPIVDFGLPSRELMTHVLNAIDAAIADGQKVYVHCHGGIGRTGTTVGCFLVRHGMCGREALEKLAGWWAQVPKSARHPHSPETSMQRAFVLDWAG